MRLVWASSSFLRRSSLSSSSFNSISSWVLLSFLEIWFLFYLSLVPVFNLSLAQIVTPFAYTNWAVVSVVSATRFSISSSSFSSSMLFLRASSIRVVCALHSSSSRSISLNTWSKLRFILWKWKKHNKWNVCQLKIEIQNTFKQQTFDSKKTQPEMNDVVSAAKFT